VHIDALDWICGCGAIPDEWDSMSCGSHQRNSCRRRKSTNM